MTLDAVEFIRRFLLHILPAGFVRIRQFGFLANRARREKLELCRALLGAPSAPPRSAAATRRSEGQKNGRETVPGLPDRSPDSHPAPACRTPGYPAAAGRFIMMRLLPDCRTRAFSEAGAGLRLPGIFPQRQQLPQTALGSTAPTPGHHISRSSRRQNHSAIPARKVRNIFKTHSCPVRLSSTDSIGNAPARM